MILTYNELCDLVDSGAVTGVPRENINGASIDLTLGDVFWAEENPDKHSAFCLLDAKAPPRMRMYKAPEFDLYPGQFCLAQTREMFNLPDDVAGHYMLKSSLARSGLQHLFAGFADPTWHSSVLTLEFVNVLRYHTLVLTPGMKCGQMVFFKGSSAVPEAMSYAVRGQYNRSTAAEPSKGVR